MEYNINFTYEDNKQLKEIYKELLKRNYIIDNIS